MTRAPLPGRPVRGSDTGRPVMALLDLLGRRWTLRILWELRTDAKGFRALQAACDQMSPTVLTTRLTELRTAGIVTTENGANRLSTLGAELMNALGPLQEFAGVWSEKIREPTATGGPPTA